MSTLSSMPLRRKLTWLAMTCSVVALLTTAVSLGAYEWVFYRKAMFSHLATLSVITARNSTAAVAFANNDDATRILSALDSEPAVVAAVLYDARGLRFAEFRRPAADSSVAVPSRAPPVGVERRGNRLRISVPVAETKRFGTLLVIADISGIRARVAAYAIVLLCTTLVSGLLAYLLAGWLKERIVAPIQSLAAAASQVQTEGDYGIRVGKEADDEVGALTDGFNSMLVRIQRNEAEIARGTERLRLAVEAAWIGTWDWDVVRDSAVWNDRSYELFDVPSGTNVDSRLFYSRVDPEDEPRVRATVENARISSSEFSTEFRTRRDADAQARYVALRGRFLKSPSGETERAVGVAVDVTERRTAELRVIESELRFRAVAERAPALIWSCDQHLNRDYFNKTWLAFTGRNPDQERGLGWQDGVPPGDLARWRQIVGAAAGQRDPYSVEYRLGRNDGALRWMIETGSPRLSADGSFAGYLGSCIDITTRKENEEELEAHVRRRTRDLETANQELESFSYSVSHDLRGPVRAIQGFAEIALEEIDANSIESARERIGRVIRAADRMNKLIDAFIGMARISRAEPTMGDVDMTKIAEEVIGFLRAANPNRTVDAAVDRNLVAFGDERLLRIVIENLLGNAWKFTSHREHARIEFGAIQREGETVFHVRDNGAGFDLARAHKLFQAFERLHPNSQFEGLGVGLNTVRRVVEKHNGRVWAESTPGQGATFYFTVPVAMPSI